MHTPQPAHRSSITVYAPSRVQLPLVGTIAPFGHTRRAGHDGELSHVDVLICTMAMLPNSFPANTGLCREYTPWGMRTQVRRQGGDSLVDSAMCKRLLVVRRCPAFDPDPKGRHAWNTQR
jgi:hypothetical protein